MSNPDTTAIASATDGCTPGLELHPSTLERPKRSPATAYPANLFVGFARWIAKVQTARTRRAALSALLELDRARLEHLGIARDDLIRAIASNARAGPVDAARARNLAPDRSMF